MMPKETSKSETETDLWQFLIDFWMDTVQDEATDRVSRMKASEFLAKYILDAGKKSVKRRGTVSNKPSTTEILRLASMLEDKKT